MKVSIIIPIWGVENELEKCLSSLAAQTLDEIECIAVNDSSPDRSQEIIDRFCQAHPQRFRSFIKPNGGLSDARNFGLERASGEYIAFLDGDDYVAPNLYEVLFNKAKEGNFDLVACHTKEVYPDHPEKDRVVLHGFSGDHRSKEAAKRDLICAYPAAWNKLYKREMLEKSGVKFKRGVWFEDVEFFHRLYPFLSSVGTVDEALIYYVQREGSITHRKTKKLFDYLTDFESILSFYHAAGFFEPYHAEIEFATIRYLLATFLKRSAALERKDFAEAVQGALSLIEREFPDWRRNPYLKKSGVKGCYLKFFNPFFAKLLRLRAK